MAQWAIATCGVLYLLTALDLARERQYGLAAAFFFYACANVGLMMAARRT